MLGAGEMLLLPATTRWLLEATSARVVQRFCVRTAYFVSPLVAATAVWFTPQSSFRRRMPVMHRTRRRGVIDLNVCLTGWSGSSSVVCLVTCADITITRSTQAAAAAVLSHSVLVNK